MRKETELNAAECLAFHQSLFEHWEHGEIVESWRDAAGILCIRYSSGAWWHYSTDKRGNITFW